ncbi:MAG: 2-succinyl-5-enolpyruvyl-6-hydroxy-3-cyclohexene-1-carboxylic-acid synthase [Tannerellaceae bacterium]|jgi:2-succinyl-5-enolpyruvyl-6-hydroxy-3-cyclohexene-1-carboxylate synthase|nr:2-succinyl-5-enolpyruvyl-6-hydroxy-3-cyclohexene-1-carboxylic-acid synthase [Tannerellaceae bacterium]
MYSNKKNVLELVSLLKAHGVSQAVLSPGSRNIPIVKSLAADAFFTCHTVVDERGAGFYAIGIAQHTGQAVAVCCTSGTAVLNYAPAVAEAFYQELPLIVITADRPAAWIGQMAGQTLPQQGVFGALVKKSFQLPEIMSDEDGWYCNRLVNEALLETRRHRRGPVHINVPLSEPLFECPEEQLPRARVINRRSPQTVFPAVYGTSFLRRRRRMIIAGQSAGGEMSAEPDKLIGSHDCVVLAEHISNLPHSRYIRNFDALLCSIPPGEEAHYAPDLLITTGGHIVSKRIRQFLKANPPEEHWHVSPGGEVADTFQCLTDVIEAEGRDFIAYLATLPRPAVSTDGYAMRWLSCSRSLPEPKAVFSDLMAVGRLIKSLPEEANLQLANSSSVRLVQLFSLKGRQRVFCNRGTSGIDGCLSTAIGQASVSPGVPTFLIIGDLSFFYDINALWNPLSNPSQLRILLNNNGGGGIFHTLPGLESSRITDRHIATSHAAGARVWAEGLGITYFPVSNEEEFEAYLPTFISREAAGPMLMEVFTSKEKNAAILKNYYSSLRDSL